jgi:hypothetical protein
MIFRGGWAEADAMVVVLSLSNARGAGLAVRTRQTVAAAICHGLHASIERAGEHMTSPAPDLFLPARGLPECGMQHALFDCEPSAAVFERHGSGEGKGEIVTLCTPLIVHDNPLFLTDCGILLYSVHGTHQIAPGDVVCIRSRPNALPYCRTFALVIGDVAAPLTRCLQTRN